MAIVPALRGDGHDVRVRAGGHALDLLGEVDEEIAPVTPGWTGARVLPARVAQDLARLRRDRPRLVISDGDLPSVIAAKALGIPTLAIGHDCVFNRCALPADLPRRLLARQRLISLQAARADAAVAVHFLPIAPARPRTRVARPALGRLAGEITDDGSVLAYFRDGDGHDALRAAVAAGARVRVFGQPPRGLAGVDARPFDRDAFAAALRACACVIASAGSNVLAECVLLGKPVLALHPAREAEPALNALLLERAGAGARGVLGEVTPAQVSAFVARVRAGGFARVDLAAALPDVTDAARAAVRDLLS